MAFHDVRLPDHVERGARGGPMFKTTIIELANGAEQRNIDWSLTRHYWDVGYGVMDRKDYEEVRAFFLNRRGRAHTFRFRDWTDYQVEDEVLGTGDASRTEFQLIKTYSGELDYVRTITRPDASTLVVKVNGVATLAYTLQTGGVVEMNAAPGEGDIVSWTGDFDIPMRFDTDKFELEAAWSEAAGVPGLPVIEVRE